MSGLFYCRAQDTTADGLQNVSKTIEDLLDGYDIRLRPQFGGKSFLLDLPTPPINVPLNTQHRSNTGPTLPSVHPALAQCHVFSVFSI